MISDGGWFWYFSGKEEILDPEKCGKWMFFFEEEQQEFAKEICQKAIDNNICYECKCSDIKTRIMMNNQSTGVICFYQNGDDIENHKRIINFMIENNLIKRINDKCFYNISFKYDYQTIA
eukprot:jgi/Orpsp1_1/1187496/evm.model.d7180000058145.1